MTLSAAKKLITGSICAIAIFGLMALAAPVILERASEAPGVAVVNEAPEFQTLYGPLADMGIKNYSVGDLRYHGYNFTNEAYEVLADAV